MRLRLVILILLCVGLPPSRTHAQARSPLTPALQRAVSDAAPGDRLAVWVFLSDKDDTGTDGLERALTPHARARRARNRSAGHLVDRYDVPVSARYVDRLRREGIAVRHVSRWLNAVSVDATAAETQRLAALPFVSKLDVVRSGRAPLPEPSRESTGFGISAPAALNYGPSAAQIQTIGVHTLHDQGLTGDGVWVAMFDTGFNNLGHAVFATLDVLATRDFVNGDDVVSDEPGQMGSGNHGMQVLSVIAGNAPGNLIGPAFGASYVLAKTENTSWERHIEEDAWVAAAEWVDSLGVDIISSSVGYSIGFTDGEPSYPWQDLDGATTIATIGADIAASRGILVVNSAGNDGLVSLPANSLIGPCDGDDVLCVGSVDAAGVRASFSSVGPTADGRIKPDVMAMGLAVTVASPFDQVSYLGSSGTSFSCPLIAGVAALLLEAWPTASNASIIAALRVTASQSATPDRLMGWGIVDAPAALAIVPTAVGGGATPAPARVALHAARPNPFNPATLIDYELAVPARVTLAVYDAAGRLVDTLLDGAYRPAGVHSERYQSQRASGVYFVKLSAGGESATGKIVLLK